MLCVKLFFNSTSSTNTHHNQFKMKAAVRTKYGLPGDLTIKELDIPTPKDDEVLIRVHATTVNRSDCHVLSGKPFFMRLFTGLFKPKSSIIGSDFTGQIEAVGSTVQSFKESRGYWQ